MTLATRLRPLLPTGHIQDVSARFLHRVAISDLLVIIWAVVGAQVIRFGPAPGKAILSADAFSVDLRYTGFSVVLIVTWVLMLRLHGA